MDNRITLSFTSGQLFAIIGAICLIAITIYLVSLLKVAKKTMQQLNETLSSANEVIEDFQATKMLITSKLAEVQRLIDFSKAFGEMKEKFTFMKKKKKQGED